jgi:CRISPR/Cas system-associated exonuclease Cas4 (RecB family)
VSIFGQVFGTPLPSVPAPPPITAWSYSRLSVYEGCPRRAKYQFVDKLAEPEGEAIVRGKQIHEAAAEMLVTGTEEFANDDVNSTLRPWRNTIKMLRGMASRAEFSAAFDIDWAECEWFSRRAWLRIVFDVIVPPSADGTVMVLDWKTGKPRDSHASQQSLYACGASTLYPDAKKIEVSFAYLDYPTKPPVLASYDAAGIPALKAAWEERASPMLRDTEFPTRVGPRCQWCPYAKSKGGPCEQG